MSQVNLSQIESNSHTHKERVNNETSVQKVTTGKVIKKQKPARKKVMEMFFSEDIPNIKDYLVYDLLIPSFKQVFVDTLQNTIDLVFWGKVRGRAGSKSNNGTYVSYNSFSRPQLTSSNRRLDYDFTELEFETRDDAENVLEVLRDIVDRYGKVKVADLYDACGVTGNGYTDEDYGWRDLRDARVVRTRSGFIFDMPRPIQFR